MPSSNESRIQAASLLLMCVVATACASGGTTAPPPPQPTGAGPVVVRTGLPPVPSIEGALVLDVVYPPEGERVTSRDSTFVFGSAGTGSAQVTVNGTPVTVAPNGAWLAFLPVPVDGLYRLQGTSPAGQTATFERRVLVPVSTAQDGPFVAGSEFPRGNWVVQPGERIDVGFRGAAGGRAALVFPDGTRVPLIESRALTDASQAARDFAVNAQAGTPQPVRGNSDYRGFFIARPIVSRDTSIALPTLEALPDAARDSALERLSAGRVPGIDRQAGARTPALRDSPTLSAEERRRLISATPRPGGGAALFELIVGSDTAYTTVPLNVAVLAPGRPRTGVTFDPDPNNPDRRGYAVARPGTSGPFHYLWPFGTELTLTGERGGLYRAQLSGDLSVWVSKAEVRVQPAGAPPPLAQVTSIRLTPRTESVDARFTLGGRRLPFFVTALERTIHIDVYGATSHANIMQYGSLDPLIARAVWSQAQNDVLRLTIDLTQPVWGYQPEFADNGDLIVRIRRPPAIDAQSPLRGLLIALDAGHPPGGAIGPTRLTEAEANLAVAQRLRPMLEAAGARVLMLRNDNTAVPLNSRPATAREQNAHIYVSVHNNAFADGVNPFVNTGTSIYYFHPNSVDLARLMQEELLREFGLRDLGVRQGDFAVIRGTWMPAVLTETMFLMVPQEEAALRNPEVHERVAQAHLRALERFARARAAAR